MVWYIIKKTFKVLKEDVEELKQKIQIFYCNNTVKQTYLFYVQYRVAQSRITFAVMFYYFLKLYDYCLDENITDKNLTAKRKKFG
ncbi:hypothetical protein V1478_001222 [Vespula squamosa]|uniref:Uncharacterized protein n=1 Tax=Vespula squamosa TaxID=30214 RepID=A0ABD2C7R0_VESSQ